MGPFITVMEDKFHKKKLNNNQFDSSSLASEKNIVSEKNYYWIWIVHQNNQYSIQAIRVKDSRVVPDYDNKITLKFVNTIAKQFNLPYEIESYIFSASKIRNIKVLPIALEIFNPRNQKFYTIGITETKFDFFNDEVSRFPHGRNSRSNSVYQSALERLQRLTELKKNSSLRNEFSQSVKSWYTKKIENFPSSFKNLRCLLHNEKTSFSLNDKLELVNLIEGILNDHPNYKQYKEILAIIECSGIKQLKFIKNLETIRFNQKMDLIFGMTPDIDEQIAGLIELCKTFEQFKVICNNLQDKQKVFITELGLDKLKKLIYTIYDLLNVFKKLEYDEFAIAEIIDTYTDNDLAKLITNLGFSNDEINIYKIFNLLPSIRISGILSACLRLNIFSSNIEMTQKIIKELPILKSKSILTSEVLQNLFFNIETKPEFVHNFLKNSNIYQYPELKHIFLSSLPEEKLFILNRAETIIDIFWLIDIYEERIAEFELIVSFLLENIDSAKKFNCLFRETCTNKTHSGKFGLFYSFFNVEYDLNKTVALFEIFFPNKVQELIFDENKQINIENKRLVLEYLSDSQKNQVKVMLEEYENNLCNDSKISVSF